jgi:hypothetical protein
MNERKFRNKVQKARNLREEIRKNRFLGTETSADTFQILNDREREGEQLTQLNTLMDDTQKEFCEDFSLKGLANESEWIGGIKCTKVGFVGKQDGGLDEILNTWLVLDNAKKVEGQHKELNKMRNKLEKISKKALPKLTIDEELMANALGGNYSPKN